MADKDLKELKIKVTFDMESLNKSANSLKSALNKISSDLSKSFKIDLSNAINTSKLNNLKNLIQKQLSGSIDIGINANINANKSNNISGVSSVIGAAGMSNSASSIKDAGNTLIEGGREVSNGAISVKSSIEGFNVVIGQLEKTLLALKTIMESTNDIMGSTNKMASNLEKLQELQVLRSYTKDALNYVDKIKELINSINTGLDKDRNKIELTDLEDKARNIRDISDNIVNNFKAFGDFNFFDGNEAKALISDLELANDALKELIKNKNTLSDFSIFDSNDSQGFGGPDSSIDEFIKALTEDLDKAISNEELFNKYSEDMAKDVASNMNLIPPSINRIKEEAAVMKQALQMEGIPENGIGLLKALQNIENAYKGTLSSIKSEDLSKLLNDKFNISLDPSTILEFGNNMNAVLNTIDRDTISINDSIENIADAADLSAGRIALGMRQAFAPLQSMRDLSNPAKETSEEISSSIRNVIPWTEKLKKSLKSAFTTNYSDSINNFKKSTQNLKSSFNDLIKSVKSLFNQNDQTTNNNLDKMNDKANKTHSGIKGLLKSLAGLFGIYQLFSVLKEGTNDAIQFESAMMNVQRTLKGASNSIMDFANNQAVLFGIGKSQVAEYSNIYSLLISNFEKDVNKNALLTQQLLESAGIIASKTGYDVDYVLQGLRSGVLGSSEAVDQFGLSLKVANLEASETFRTIANGASSWNNLTSAQQQQIIVQEIINQTTSNFGTVANNTASRLAIFKAQTSNTVLALGRIGASILTAVLPALTVLMKALETAFNFIATLISQILALFGITVDFMSNAGSSISDSFGDIGGAGGELADVSDGLDSVGDSAEGAGKKIKDMLGLASFDEINALNKPDDSGSGGSGGGGGGGGSNPSAGSGGGGGVEYGETESALDKISEKVSAFAEKIKNLLLTIWEPIKAGWDNIGPSILSHFEELKQAASNLWRSIKDLFVGIWENGGKELLQGITELILVLVDCAIIITTDVINAFANFFDYINPDRNKYTRKLIEVLNELMQVGKDCAYALANAFGTFLQNGGQAFLNVMGDIVMLIGTILVEILTDVIGLIGSFFDSWAGTVVITTVAVTLDVLAGILKAVLIAIEKLLPVIELLGIAFGALALSKIVSDFNNVWSAISAGSAPLNSMSTIGGQLANKLGLIKSNVILTKDAFIKFVKDGIKSAISQCGNLFKEVRKLESKFLEFGKTLVSNVITGLKNFSKFLKDPITGLKNMYNSLLNNIKALGNWIKTMAVSAWNAIKNFASACLTGIANLLGLTAAEGSATVGATALSVALDLLGIGLIIAAVVGLIAAVKAIAKHFDEWKEKINSMLDSWGWFGDALQWVGEKIGWLWDKIKGFFGWDDNNNIEDELNDTTYAAENLGEEITTTSDKFGTASSVINQHLNEINFPGSKLASQADEALNSMTEKYGMLSKTTQDYFEALVNGDKEALDNMQIDTSAAMNEMKSMYADLNEEEKNQFYATYGYIEGINDDWLDDSGLTYDQLVAKHVAYCENIMNNESLTYEEKQRLMDEDKARYETYFEDLKQQAKDYRDERLSQEGLSHEDRYRIEQEYSQQIRAIENERIDSTIEKLGSVEDAEIEKNEAIKKSAESVSKAQTDALEGIDKSLDTTSKNLNDFKKKSDEVAKSIPESWNGITTAIGKVFSSIDVGIGKTMDSILSKVRSKAQSMTSAMTTEVNKINTSTITSFNNISNNVNNTMNILVNNIRSKINAMTENINNSLKSCSNSISNIMKSINSNVSNVLNNMNSNISNSMSKTKTTFNNGFNGIDGIVSNNMSKANTALSTKLNNLLSTLKTGVSNLKSTWDNLSFNVKTPYLKMPHITVYGSLDMSTKPVKVPQFSVSYWATGGIVNKATLLNANVIGEAGTEAILPLQGSNGDYWMNKVADNISNRINSNNGSNTPLNITFKVGEYEFAKACVDGINNLQAQAGEVLLDL